MEGDSALVTLFLYMGYFLSMFALYARFIKYGFHLSPQAKIYGFIALYKLSYYVRKKF